MRWEAEPVFLAFARLEINSVQGANRASGVVK